MSRSLCAAMVAAAVMTVTGTPASAAPDGDFVVGTGEITQSSPFPPPDTIQLEISIDAHSDASGGNPSGSFTVVFPAGGYTIIDAPVTCLEVTGNTAIIGWFDLAFGGHARVQVVDNSTSGSADTISAPDTSDPAGIGGCSSFQGDGQEFPLVSGDFVVHDAPTLTSKGQCKDGGWRDFTDDEGNPFENQGDCVAFMQHGT